MAFFWRALKWVRMPDIYPVEESYPCFIGPSILATINGWKLDYTSDRRCSNLDIKIRARVLATVIPLLAYELICAHMSMPVFRDQFSHSRLGHLDHRNHHLRPEIMDEVSSGRVPAYT